LVWIKWFTRFLWNGGLEVNSADPSVLRERRTVSATILFLMPIACILMLANTYFFDASAENVPILIGMAVLLTALCLQAAKGWSQLAAHLLISVFWFAPTSLVASLGLNSTNWVFLLLLSPLALLLGGIRSAILWTIIAICTLWAFVALTQLGYLDIGVRVERHAIAVGISGPLVIIMLAIAGATFRSFQVQAEQKLQTNVRRLGEEVDTRRAAEEAALAAERAKAVFLSTMSHELRTPLNGVIGAGQLLKNTQLDSEQQELVDVVTNSGEILLDLINDVLDLSKLEAGRFELERQPVQVVQLVESSISPLRIMGRDKQVAVNYEIDPDVPEWVSGDPLRLRQILLNLCGNALKFTKQGRIHIYVKNSDAGLLFAVEDTGIGIENDAMVKLFQPFTQAGSSTARQFGGTGLGLTIVKQLVDLMGGKIELDSTVGVGTTFSVFLPLQACDVEAPLVSLAPKTEPIKPTVLKVLVTDDNAINRMVAAKMLRRLNHIVVEAADGVEALDVVSHQPVDVVLMDVQMPNMDGLTATQKIRGMTSPLCDLPIIGLSANALDTDRSDMLAAGMNDCLSKPVKIEQLEATLDQVAKPAEV
jgi:signal transduction histidine kinase/ActR/RegA family two-component response regulator